MPSSFFPPRAERDFRNEVLASAPFPLALTYGRLHKVLDAQDPVAGAWAMRDALECCVQFAATLAVADALHAPIIDDLPSRLAETLLNPRGLSLGHWRQLLEDALRPLEPLARSGQLGGSSRHLPYLFGLVFEVRGRLRPSALARKMWGNESDVVTWRNQVFGHGVFRHDPEYYARETLRWLPVLHDFYQALIPLLADWRLVAILPHGRAVPWHGGDAPEKPLDHAHIPGAPPAPMELRHSDGRNLSLVPLLSVQPCVVCNDPAAFFFNRHQFKGGNESYDTSFLEYDRGHANRLRDWSEMRTVVARLAPTFKWERTAYDATEAEMATRVVLRDFDDEFERPGYVLDGIWGIIDNTSNGYIDLVGQGGVGKTYLARGLVADGKRLATAVLAYHIVPGVLTDYRSFVVELSMQARETLRLRTQEPQTQGSTPKDLRREIVGFLGTLRTANQLDALIVVIDGLDELPEPSNGSISIVDLLPDPSQLPEGCFVVLTRRPEIRPTAVRLIRRLNTDASGRIHTISLDPVSPDALALLRSYLERQLPPAWCTADSIDAIVAQSGGVFLYAFHLVSALRSGAFADRASLPTAADLYPAYLAALRQRAGDELFGRVYEPLLVFIAAAHQPISIEQLVSWGIPSTLIPFALLDIRDFLRREIPALNAQQGMHDRFEIAHEEFRTWLGNDEDWRSKIGATHLRVGLVAITRHGGRWHEHVPDDETDYYDLLWTEAHLELGRAEEQLRSLRSDSTYPYACRQAAVRCLDRGRLVTALALVERAVAVHRRPEALKQIIWVDDLADALADRATVLEALGRLTEAIVTLDEAIDLYRQVVASGRLAPQRELAGLLLHKANILDRLRRPQEALALYDEARHLDALFEKIDSDSANLRAGQWALNRGAALVNLGQLDEARAVLQDSVRRLKLAHSEAHLEHQAATALSLAMALMNHGIALDRHQQSAEAVDLYAEAEQLLAEHASPGDPDSELMRATLAVNRGLALTLLERHDEAIAAFNAAIHARRVLIAAGRSELEADLASALVGRGDFRLGTDTLPYLEEAIEIYRRVANDSRPDLQEHLAAALLNLGHYHWEQGDGGDALRAFTDSIRFSDGLARQDRRNQVPIFLRALTARIELLVAMAERESAAADLTTICQVVAYFTRRHDDDSQLVTEWERALRSIGRMHDDTRIQLLAKLQPAIRNAILTALADLSSDSHEG